MKKIIGLLLCGLALTGCAQKRTFMVDAEMAKKAEVLYCTDQGLHNLMYFGDQLIIVCRGEIGDRKTFLVNGGLD